jgi:RNase P/RNase MRP subunit p29
VTNVVAKTEEAQSWNRGDVILATMQALRAQRGQSKTAAVPSKTPEFDEAHGVVDRLIADGFVQVPA